MIDDVIIRPYEKKDRNALRQLCCDVADRGKSIESIFFDREVAADLLTAYYTDFEPDATFIAESKGQLVGYINACLDNRRYGLATMWFIIPRVFAKAFKRGVFFRREFWSLIKTWVRNWPRLMTWRKQSFNSHQGHVHIGIAQSFRKHRVGARLVDSMYHYAQSKGTVRELAATVHSLNVPGCRFFESQGFHAASRYPMVAARLNGIEEYESVLYVKEV